MTEHSIRWPAEGVQLIWAVAKIINGAVLAQLALFAVTPLLTRLYSPADFSAYLVYTSVLSFVVIIANLRYEVAIVQERDDQAARDVWLFSFLVNMFMTGLAVLIVVGLSALKPLSSWQELYQIRWLLPPAIFLCGIQLSLNYLTLRSQAHGVVGMASAARGLGTAATGVGLGLGGIGMAGLPAADLLGRVAGTAVLLRRHGVTLWRNWPHRLPSRMCELATKHKSLPLLSLPSALVNVAGGVLTPLLMVAIYDATTSGQFALVERGIALPLSVLIQSSAQVYISVFPKAWAEDKAAAAQLFRKFILAHLLLALVPCALLLLLAKPIFALVFGPGWSMAAEMAQVMAPMLLISTANGPVSMTLVLIGRQPHNLAFDLGRLALLGGVWAVVVLESLDPRWAVAAHAAAFSVLSLVFILLAYCQLRAAMGGRDKAKEPMARPRQEEAMPAAESSCERRSRE